MHDQRPCRGSRVRRHEATHDNEYSTSFSFPSTWKGAHTHSHTITHKKRSTGEHVGCFGNKRRWNVILQWRAQRWQPGRSREVGAYSSNVRKEFCMSSSSWAYSALILASPSFTGSWGDKRNTVLQARSEHFELRKEKPLPCGTMHRFEHRIRKMFYLYVTNEQYCNVEEAEVK